MTRLSRQAFFFERILLKNQNNETTHQTANFFFLVFLAFVVSKSGGKVATKSPVNGTENENGDEKTKTTKFGPARLTNENWKGYFDFNENKWPNTSITKMPASPCLNHLGQSYSHASGVVGGQGLVPSTTQGLRARQQQGLDAIGGLIES